MGELHHYSDLIWMGRRAFLVGLVVLGGHAGSVFAERVVGDPWASEAIQLPRLEHLRKPPIVTAVAIRPGGAELAIAGDDHLVRLWDLEQRRWLGSLSGHGDWVRTLEFSPDGNSLASAGNDGRVLVWNPDNGQLQYEHLAEATLTRVIFDNRGNRLLTIGFRDRLRVLDLPQEGQLFSVGCPCVDMRALAVSPDNRIIAAGGRNGRIRIWSTDDGSVLAEFAAHQQRIRGLQFTTDGARLISCGEDRVLRVSDLDGKVDFRVSIDSAKLMSLSNCGGSQVAIGGSDNQIHIWDLQARQEVTKLAGHTGSVAALCYAEGALVSAGFDTVVRVWRHTNNVAEDHRQPTRRVGEHQREGDNIR
jgi:WD40 repeat protein